MDKNRTLARHSAQSLDLAAQLDSYIKLVAWARECLESNLTGGMGYKKDGLSKDDANALSAVGISLERAVSTKIKYDKHVKTLTEQMTKVEELAAVEEYIAGLDDEVRYDLLYRAVNRHNDLLGGKRKSSLKPMKPGE